ncbi:MAG: GNAT family N-acetyltransferase [Bacteroidales bacterium]
MENFIIRDYLESDYPALINLWESTGLGGAHRGDDAGVIRKTIEAGGKLLILETESDATLAGSSWLTNDGRRIYLHHFGILPPLQGKGLAKQLLAASIDFAKQKELQLKIEVHRQNRVAIALYKKYGFSYLGDYDIYIIRKYS